MILDMIPEDRVILVFLTVGVLLALVLPYLAIVLTGIVLDQMKGSNAMECTWVTVEGVSPKWTRQAALGSDGNVYIPVVVAGDESRVSLMAIWDGETILEQDKHFYIRSGWIKREFPDVAETARLIERKVRAVVNVTEEQGG